MDNQQPKPWFKTPKIIFIILGVVILAEVLFAISFLSQRLPSPPAPLAPQTGGKLELLAQDTKYRVGQKVPVSVYVSTGGHPTDGVDVILRFDPSRLEASASGLVRGKIYPEFPQMSVDKDEGVIRISGIVSPTGLEFNGNGVLATINFLTKAPGKTILTLDFLKGQTTDSNITETGSAKDILEKVENLEVNILP